MTVTDLKQLTPHELLARIENRNRRFKIASVVFGGVLTGGLIVLLVLGLDTLQKVNIQLASQQKLLTNQQQTLAAIGASGKQRTAQINDLQAHIDCLFKIATTPHTTTNPPLVSSLSECSLTTPSGSSGASNGTQKSNTTPINSNGGTTRQAQPAASSQPSQNPNPAPAPKSPLKTLFCKVDLLHLACNG